MPRPPQATSPAPLISRGRARRIASRHVGMALLLSATMVLGGILLYLWPQVRLVSLGYRQGKLLAQRTPITHTGHLAEVVARTIPRAAWPPHIHPATRVFLALRMAVNEELPALAAALPQAAAALRPGGRLGVVAFHSGEDQHVKTFLRQEARGCVCPPHIPQCICGRQPQLRLVTRKPPQCAATCC